MASFYTDNADLQFYVDKGIDWEPLVELTEFGYRSPDGFDNAKDAVEMYRDILGMVGDFVAERIAPFEAQIDREGVHLGEDGEVIFPDRLQGIFDEIKALELHGLTLPRELGGQNCPMLMFSIVTEIFARADVSVMAHHGFHGGIAMAMLVYSLNEGTTEFDVEKGVITKTRFQKEIEEIRRGDAWGCMDITEPNAGSDMAALAATGEQDEDGNWFVTGQKIFITSGHGKYHFVIARTEKSSNPDDPFAGLGGLSMFLVPCYEDDENGNRKRIVKIDRLEEKLGHHGSATAALTFERAPAHLIGKRGEGFKYMLMLMNGARVGVGFECIGLCESALRMARAYAADRGSMGKSIDKHEMIADYLDEMQSDVEGLRAMVMYGAWHDEMAKKLGLMVDSGIISNQLEAKQKRKLQKKHQRKARRVTPLLKYLAAEKAVEMAQRAIQIHGGVGYTTEYGAEKLLRDAMVMPIYEGTSQIQALMAMRDTLLGAMKKPRRFARRIADAKWRATSSRDLNDKALARVQALSLSAQQHLLTRTAADKYRSLKGEPFSEWPEKFFKNWDPKKDFSYAMLHAERLTILLADEAICEILYEQAQAHPERWDVFERYVERAEPRARYMHDQITSTGSRIVNRLRREAESLERESA